ncbi:MAG TPA: DUF1361 domain-containing protein [Thermoleophilia bacterium]
MTESSSPATKCRCSRRSGEADAAAGLNQPLARTGEATPARHRFAAAIVGLLVGASLVCVGLVAARMVYSHTVNYWFLMWNLALAWVPFIFAGVAYTLASAHRAILYALIVVAAFVWLVFFPNAPYILTDFLHLGSMGDTVPGWYDVLMLFWFAWTGLMLGVVSLYLMQDIVSRAFGGAAGWVFVIAAAGIGSFGIYLGRFLRWNSWDLLRRPMPLAGELYGKVTDPASQPRLLGFTLLFALLFLFIYVAVYIFAKLANPAVHTGDR